MFQNPFSFEGRINRTEYGFSLIIFAIAYLILFAITDPGSELYAITDPGSEGGSVLVLIFLIPMLWFIGAQGAKRSHDIGNSGWLQLIPFYGIFLLFQRGQPGPNQYGENTKYNLSVRWYGFLSRLFMLAGIFMLSQAVFSFLGMALCTRLYNLSYGEMVGLISKPQLTPEGVYTQRWVQSFYNIGSFLISAIVFAGLYRKPIPETLGLSSPAPLKQLLFVLAIAFTAVPVVSGLSAFNLKLPGIDQWADLNKLQASRDARLQVLLYSYSWLDSLFLVIALALVPAVSEEVFFRGLLQRFFSSWSYNKHIGIGVSAMLFTLLHFSVTQFVPILFMGLLLGYLYSWTGNLWVCILVHFLNNATTVIFHRLSAQYQSVQMFQDDYQPSALVFWLAVVFLFGILFWLYRKENRTATIESIWP